MTILSQITILHKQKRSLIVMWFVKNRRIIC